MPRKSIEPEELFYQSVTNLIKNMFTKANPNFASFYYAKQGGFEFQREVEKMAELVLQKMEDWKHLIDPNFGEETTKTP